MRDFSAMEGLSGQLADRIPCAESSFLAARFLRRPMIPLLFLVSDRIGDAGEEDCQVAS